MTSDNDTEPLYVVGLYAAFSFVCVMLLVLLLYAACARKFRLNWFEKNLLENADDGKQLKESRQALVGVHEAAFKNRETLYPSPVANRELDLQRENCQSEDASTENLVPTSPSSTSSYQFPVFTGPIPLASNDTQIVLSSSNAAAMRPRVSSMQSKLDHTKIDTSLYQQESPAEPENVMGTVHVSLAFDPISGLLTVRLIEAQDLQARDFSGTADPYAKIRLLPDKTNVWQTKIHKKTLNPVFDEDFVFEVQPAVLARHVLEILLYDFDAYSRHYNIGSVQVPLSDLDLGEKVSMWRPLAQHVPDDPRVNVGELMVSLAYLPSAERLTVIVIKARNLKVVDVSRNSSDPYVKVSLVQDKKKLKKRKTGVHRSTLSPVFNEALTFDIDKETLRKCTLDFCVMHDSLVGTSEPLGVCRVGRTKDCRQEERHFFHEMLHSKTASAKWLTLSDPRIQ